MTVGKYEVNMRTHTSRQTSSFRERALSLFLIRTVFLIVGFIVFSLFAGQSEAQQTPVPSCIQPPSGIISWWPGDGNASDVIGQNTGTLQGGATYTSGVVGQAFRFDGTDGYVIVPNPTGLPLGVSPRTVEFWINTERLYNSSRKTHLHGIS